MTESIDAGQGRKGESPSTPPGPTRLQIALFVAAVVTVSTAGLYAAGLDPFQPTQWEGQALWRAASYTLWLLAIVAAHEAGHYVAARRCGVVVSRPYFLPGLGPIPGLGVIPFFGTFGAFIRMELKTMRARDLMAIAGWGPVAGFAVTVPAVVIGVFLSEPTVVTEDAGLLLLGDSLLILGATAIFHPEMGSDMELMLHPIGLAGWVGCLLTALNLLPLGQLDGGHLAYSVFGRGSRVVTASVFSLLVLLGLFAFAGWLVIAVLVWWMGLAHPAMLSDGVAPRGERKMVWVCAVIFVLTFAPAPVVVDTIPEMLGLY